MSTFESYTPSMYYGVLVLIAAVIFVCLRMLRSGGSKLHNDWRSDTRMGPHVGVSSIQGNRPHMEDTYQAIDGFRGDPKCGFYAVYDGHGGARASAYAAQHLHNILADKDLSAGVEKALTESFLELDHDWLNTLDFDDGSTATVALVYDGKIYVANIGDSRAVLASSNKSVPLSSDHKPNRPDERLRVESNGGRIMFYGTWRVQGMLAVTRSFGDRRLKRWVIAEPEIFVRDLTSEDEYLILATDGVWDVMSEQDSVDITCRAENPSQAADDLTVMSHKRGSQDNITSLIVNLSQYTA